MKDKPGEIYAKLPDKTFAIVLASNTKLKIPVRRARITNTNTTANTNTDVQKKQIPVRRARRTSDPCPESHRRLAMRFPSLASSDQNPPKSLLTTINIVLTLQEGGWITGNHRLDRQRWVPMLRRSSARQKSAS